MIGHLLARGWIAPLLALLFFVLCLPLTKAKPESWNDISRVAAMESLVERGTWAIDDSPWLELTEDKVLLRERFYSGKMPLLSWLGAGLYTALRGFAGLSLAPDCATTASGCAYYWITLILIGVPASLLIGLFYDFARHLNIATGAAVLGTVALGWGTMIWPYSLVLNHHLPAAVGLFVAFYLLRTRAVRNSRWLLGSGFCVALALGSDPLAGLLGTALLVLAGIGFRQGALYFLLGALPPLLLTAWLDLQITGTVLPPYLIPDGYVYQGAIPGRGPAGTGTPDDPAQYAFKMFIGAQGLLAYNPVLLFALLGLFIVAAKREHPLRLEALVLGAAFVALAFYLALRTGNLGGQAYGERYFVHALPLVMSFLWFAPPLATRYRLVTAPFFIAALVLSILSSYQGALHPWLYSQPPMHLTRNPQTGAIGWRWNLRFPLR